MTQAVFYQIDITDLGGHLLAVTLRFTPTSARHQLSLPAWLPGSYMIRDFARNITAISAGDSAGPLLLQQLDKQSWQLDCRQHTVTVCYQIYAYDLSVRAAYVDDEVAVLNPACLCLAVSNLQHLPHQLELNKPTATLCQHWQVATGLTPSEHTPWLGFGIYTASDYASLIDSPLLAGELSVAEFYVAAIPHYLVLTGDNLTDLPRFTADLTRICQQQALVFGSLPPDLPSYWFLLWLTEEGYGGLEHMNSTLLLSDRYSLPIPARPDSDITDIDDSYQELLALCSHEYFHTWWVKRLKPACFKPYKLGSEQYTPQLWLYEGFTSYYDDLALVRSGLIGTECYIRTLEKLISRVTRNPSDSRQSLADSSFTAWTKFYKQDENAPNAVVSYYAKGALLALCLEAELTDSGSQLDAVVRRLWQNYLATGTPDNALQLTLQQLGFAQLAIQCDNWIHNTRPLPLQQLLPKLGLSLSLRAMQHSDDLGGATADSGSFIGMQSKPVNGLLQVTQVYHGSSAHQAGIMAGDQLLALNQRKISTLSWPQLLKRYPPNSVVSLSLFRKDRLLTLTLTLSPAVQQVAVLSVTDEARCQRWLSAKE